MSRKIIKARRIMLKAFKADPGFRMGYEANIAMLIYDDQHKEINQWVSEKPMNLMTKEGCNAIADRILTLIFSG